MDNKHIRIASRVLTILITLSLMVLSFIVGMITISSEWLSNKHMLSELSHKAEIIAAVIDERQCSNRGGYYEEYGGELAKPAIYLYPEEKTDIRVSIEETNINLDTTYPKYNNGWSITADKDGSIIDKQDNTNHRYLFWEGTGNIAWDMSKGFVVNKEETESFLKQALSVQGLNEQEINDFIVYWLPRLNESEYNLITFQNEIYSKEVPLEINPLPDTLIRVFMVYKPLEKYIDIQEQELNRIERIGYTVIEWGGSEVDTNTIR